MSRRSQKRAEANRASRGEPRVPDAPPLWLREGVRMSPAPPPPTDDDLLRYDAMKRSKFEHV